MLYYMGSFGPSLLYMLSVTIFAALTLTASFTKLTVWINILICVIYGVVLQMGFLPEIDDLARGDALGWIGIASNLVFVSVLFMILIPRLYHGLQSQIDLNKTLHKEL